MLSHLMRAGALVVVLSGVCAAQTLPSVVLASNQYVLTIPYLEYGSGASKQGYGAVLRSSDLSTFVLDATSVTSQPALAAATDSPTVAPINAGYRLVVPRVRYGTQYYAVAFNSTDLSRFVVDPSTVAEVTPPGTLNGPTVVMIANVGERTVGSSRIFSSSKLSVSWRAPTGYTVDHYEVTAAESIFGTSVTATVSTTDTSATLTGLKAVTPYSVTVKACGNSACTQSGVSSPVLGTTAEEYWQLQGTGSSVAGLTRIVSDGNVLITAARFGPDAGGATASRIQLYYKADRATGTSVAVTSVATDAGIPASYLAFTSIGPPPLQTPPTATPLVTIVGGGVAVPLQTGNVRLFFAPVGSDGGSRILYLDSQDGFVGRDFNSGSAATCSTAADFSAGGGCVPAVAIGVEGDDVRPNSRILNARQFEVGFPTLRDWRWDGAAGTFMVFTTDAISGCSTFFINHAYAVWDGGNWQVQYDTSGCPKLFTSVQAAFPMHLGEARYKLYYGDPSVTTGRGGSRLPFLGPKRLIYADARSAGSASAVDFEDWESTSAGRNVVFVWPNGEQLGDGAEGFIDDFCFLTPTGSLDLQVMYLAITDGVQAPIAVAAVLLNP